MRPRVRYNRAFLWGLVVSAIAITVSNLADGGKDVAIWLKNGSRAEIITYYGTQLLMWPVLFMIVALIRNIYLHIREHE